MMEFFRKHKVTIILIILVGFFGGTFIAGFGVSSFGTASSFDTVAIVNGKKIPYKYFYSLYNNTLNNMRHSQQEMTTELTKALKNNILKTLIQDELIWQQTKDYGITVSDTELAYDIQSYPAFLNAQGKFDSRIYYQFLNSLMMSPKDFENLRRKQIAANKLQILIASAAKISNSEKANTNEYQLLQAKANETLNSWFDGIKRKSTIKILLDETKD